MYERSFTLQKAFKERLTNSEGKNITEEINRIIRGSKISEGLIHLQMNSDTSSMVVTNSFDHKTYYDIIDEINRNFPVFTDYATNISPTNSSARVRSIILRNSLDLVFENYKLVLGSSQAVIALEFDGPKDVSINCQLYSLKQTQSETIRINTKEKNTINVKDFIQQSITDNEIKNGSVYITVPHSTAAITVLASDDESVSSLEKTMAYLVPDRVDFKHRETPPDAAGHIKSAIWGPSKLLAIVDGKLALGEDTSIYFCEFDGPRNRKIITTYYESR